MEQRQTMITLEQYWMGRDAKYPAECTPEIRVNAYQIVAKVNTLLAMAEVDGVEPALSVRGDHVASGWRPEAVNDATANAAKNSKHCSGQAVDLADGAGRALARWCLANLDVLEQVGLWMEDPRWTPSWVHLQLVPPGSGKRVYVPSTAPALAKALPEQEGVA